MSKTAHTPGKLHLDRYGNIRTEPVGEMLPLGGVALGQRTDPEIAANDARLVACWNALEGIPNPEVVGEAIEALRLARQFAVLLMAFIVRDRGSDRQETMLDGILAEATELDARCHAILSKLEGGEA